MLTLKSLSFDELSSCNKAKFYSEKGFTMEHKQKFITESKDYISRNAVSWYVRHSNVGPIGYVSLTFVDYVQKVRMDERTLQLTSDADLTAEAICNMTLTNDSAKEFAYAILAQLGIHHDR